MKIRVVKAALFLVVVAMLLVSCNQNKNNTKGSNQTNGKHDIQAPAADQTLKGSTWLDKGQNKLIFDEAKALITIQDKDGSYPYQVIYSVKGDKLELDLTPAIQKFANYDDDYFLKDEKTRLQADFERITNLVTTDANLTDDDKETMKTFVKDSKEAVEKKQLDTVVGWMKYMKEIWVIYQLALVDKVLSDGSLKDRDAAKHARYTKIKEILTDLQTDAGLKKYIKEECEGRKKLTEIIKGLPTPAHLTFEQGKTEGTTTTLTTSSKLFLQMEEDGSQAVYILANTVFTKKN